MPDDEQNRFGRSFGEGYSYVALGFTFAVAILGFGALGWVVDGWLGTRLGFAVVGARRAARVRGDKARRPRPAARVARLPRGAFAAALCGDGIPEMIQGPDIGKVIFEHTSDSHVIEWPFGLETHLPTDWVIFGVNVSPTKHVVFMGIAAALVFLTIWYGGRQVARRHREGKAPHGFGAAVEAIVLFVRNDVAIANIGHDGAKFAPYILTLFFFILYCNLLGLLPWGAAPTGNLAVTGALALTSFLTVEISGFRALGPKGYLKTIVFVPPGMTGIGAVAMALIMTPIEIIGKIVKPFALTLRLFANMTAGHFVILALLGLIFIFGSWLVAAGSVLFVTFMMFLELLVAFLQAYIFALLTSVFIGMMQHAH